MSDVDTSVPEAQPADHSQAIAEATAGLQSKNKEILGEKKAAVERARALEEKLKAFEGVDLEEINALKQAQEEQAQKKAEEEGKYSELLAANAEKHKAEVEALQAKAENYRNQFHTKSVETQILAALDKEKGSPTLLMSAIKARLSVEENEGQISIVGLSQSGEPMMTDDGKTATVADVVAHLKTLEEYQPAFEATRISGSGSLTNKGGKVIANPWKKDSKNLTEQGRLVRENPALAAQLKSEAGVS